jgi:arginase
VAGLAEVVDLLYLHVDANILDGPLMPNHPNSEHQGPSLPQALAAVECVMATGKVAAFAVVSVYFENRSTSVDLASGVELVRGGLAAWRRYGCP